MKITILMLLCGLGSFASFSAANAACSPKNPASFKTIDVVFNVGTVVVRPTDLIGKILNGNGNGIAQFPYTVQSLESDMTCGAGTYLFEGKLLHGFNTSGNNIYATNIAGIGIRISTESPNFSYAYPYNFSLGTGTGFGLSPGPLVVEIIKTANITGSGPLKAARYSSFAIAGAPLWLTGTVNPNSIIINTTTCEFSSDKDAVVSLVTAQKAKFTGVGSTQGEKAFTLSLKCNAGASSTSSAPINDMGLTFDYTSISGNTGVMSNLVPVVTQAKGVGIQLISNYKNTETIIKTGDRLALGAFRANDSTLDFNIPMKARYYQYDPSITVGDVKALATINITYN